MCGIVGVAPSPNRPLPDLTAAVAKLARRGPDGNGIYRGPRFTLGHTRLAILDLSSAGAQPMQSHNGRFVMVYNGEIYNFAILRDELIRRGVQFRGHSDSEVLLEGYSHFGADVLGRLNGIFAVAIADLDQQELFLARDHLGVKPLYYSEGNFGFAFASEIKALMAAVKIDREIDHRAIEQYLTFVWSPGERTPFQAVKKLSPGTAMIIREGRIARQWQYWEAPRYNPQYDWTKRECAEELASCLTGSVKRQMISDAPVGAFLSGGLDSTAIVAAARKISPNISCYTMSIRGGSDGEMVDDLSYARIAAKALCVPLTEIEIASEGIADNIEQMIQTLDEPLADPACLNLFLMARAAQEQGVKVLLSGTGGDDLFSGYRRHLAAKYNRAWDFVPRPLRTLASQWASDADQTGNLRRRGAKMLRDLGKDSDARLASLYAWAAPEVTNALMLKPDYKPGQTLDILLDEMSKSENIPDIEKCLALDRRFFLADHNLTYTDKMGMFASTEIRVPLLDLEMVEFASRIPAEWKCAGMRPKWLFGQSQIGRVPDEVINRPKSGFGVPLRKWFNGELLPMAQDLLSEDTVKRRGLFSVEAVQALFKKNADGRVDASYTLLSAMCVELWCRNFFDA